MNSSSDERGPVELLAEEFLDRHQRGQRPTIDEYCARHPELASEIRDVFEALVLIEDLKPGPGDPSASSAKPTPAGSLRPRRLGDYRIVREIGRGGMGVVYEAEQEALGRRVALKVLPGGLNGDGKARDRFQFEARATARMHHTNIVPVFDVGQDGGHIYYAMQLIRGQGLDLVIDELKRLREQGPDPAPGTVAPERSLAASLILGQFEPENLAYGLEPERENRGESLEQTAETATYAGFSRSSAVLPGQSNLSTAHSDRRAYYRSVAQIGLQAAGALAYAHARGVVHRDVKPSNLLLDAAGVVWVTDFGLAKTGDLGMTQTGDILGTIRYMSPERFRGQCDVRADIYSLGLTLYELLTLKPAFSSPDRLSLVEQIRNTEPVPPRSHDARVPRDLETIVLKAIDKDPRRRYQSADDLAADLQRFIAGEPVQARRISPPERLMRWGLRNKAVASLTAAVFLVMLAGTAISTWQAIRARAAAASEKEARDSAEKREAETMAVLEFVENKVFAAARPRGQDGGMGHDVKFRDAIASALAHIGDSFANQPLIEARLRRTLGLSFSYLGDARIAAEQFEAARALYAQHRGPGDPETLRTMSRLANAYQDLGRLGDAVKLDQETLALRKAALGPHHRDTLTSMNNLANAYHDLGRLDQALQLHEETLALRKAKFGPDHPDTLQSMDNLALSYMDLGRHSEALRLHEETLALRKAKLGPNHPETLSSMNNLARSYAALSRHAEALELREQTLALRRAELGPDHPETIRSMNNLALTYAALGRREDALKLSEQTLALRRTVLGPDHPDTLRSMSNLAASYEALGHHADALKLHEETLMLRAAKLGPDHRDTLLSRLNVAKSLVQVGRSAEAAADCEQIADKLEELNRADRVSLYNAACCRAVAAAARRSAGDSPAGDRQADRAMACLQRAVAAGFKNAAVIATDLDLVALRDRDDFKKLIADLEASPPSDK